MITLLIADDFPITRAGIREILIQADDIKIVGEAQDGCEVEKLVDKLRPQILLLDLKMPGTRPADLAKWIRTNYTKTTTLVLTAYDRDVYLANMIDAGVVGYLTKKETSDKLISAIRRAANGEMLFSDNQLIRARRWVEEIGNKWNSLSSREREILRLLTQGLNNKTIAWMLNITRKTVEYHVTNLLKKLNLNSRQEVISWAQKNLPDDIE